jgi:hypothetical protein
MADGVSRWEGWNWQGFRAPQVSALLWEHWISPSDDPSSRVVLEECLPGILVWTDHHSSTWLILDQREGKRDKVYQLDGDEDVLRGDDGDDFDHAYLDWVQWLRELWRLIESTADPTPCPTKDRRPIHKPVLATRTPAAATPWRMRDEAPWRTTDLVPLKSRDLAIWTLKREALTLTLLVSYDDWYREQEWGSS